MQRIMPNPVTGAAALALPAAFAAFPTHTYAPELYSSEYGLSLAAIAVIIPVLRVMDAISNPVIGVFSDRHTDRRIAITLSGIALTVCGLLLLFAPTAAYALPRFISGTGLVMLGYSIVSIQLQTFPASVDNTTARNRLITAREGFALVGLLTAIILPYALRPYVGIPMSFFLTACVCLLLVCAVLPWFFVAMKTLPARQAGADDLSAIKKTLKSLTFPVKQFYGIYALYMLSAAIPAILVVFFIKHRLQAEPYTGGFLLFYFIAALLSLPVWRKLAGRYGIRLVWAVSCIAALCVFFFAFFLREGDTIPFIIVCFISGPAVGAGLVLPSALLTHLVKEERKESASGLYFSFTTLLQKIMAALAAALVFPLLHAAGYDAQLTQQPENALFALSFTYAALPCSIQLCVAMWLLRSRRSLGDIYDTPVLHPANPSYGNTDA